MFRMLPVRRNADHHGPDPALSGRFDLPGIAARRACLFRYDPGRVRPADMRAIHFYVKGSLHGDDLFSRKSRLRAGAQALLGGQHTGCDPGGIAQGFREPRKFPAAGRYQNPAGDRRKESAGLRRIIDINAGPIAGVPIGIPAAGLLPYKAQIRKSGPAAGRFNLPGDNLRVRMCSVDHTAIMSFPHHPGHPDAVQPSDMDCHARMGLQDLPAILRRHTHGAGHSLFEKELRSFPAFRRAAEYKNLSAFCSHMSCCFLCPVAPFVLL